MIRAVGFDLGGTLIDYDGVALSWERQYPAALSATASVWGGVVSPSQLDRGISVLRRYNTRIHPRTVEVDYTTIFGELLDALDAPASRRSALIEQAADAFFAVFQRRAVVVPAADTTIAGLSGSGVPVGVLSDVPYGMPRRLLLADLEVAGLTALEATMLTSAEVGTRKPHPGGFRRLADALGCETAEMLFVGDEEKDVLGASAAGMFAVLLWRGDGPPPKYGQHATVTRLDEVPGLVEGADAVSCRPVSASG